MNLSRRLSALDAMFVGIETHELHMHVGALLLFETGPLATPEGGVDFDRIAEHMDAILENLPNYRRRLRSIPGLRHPVWEDDRDFRLRYHLRHTALPKPGDERTLKRLAGRIFSQPLDRRRPLWEIWVVEGVENDRFALIAKVHHAMVDGIGGVELLAQILSGSKQPSRPTSYEDWKAEEAPKGLSLIREEIRYRQAGLKALLQRAQLTYREAKRGKATKAGSVTDGIVNVLRKGLAPAPDTSINPKNVSPHRRFDVCTFDLQELKDIKKVLGGKLNDVILAVCAGALRRFLSRQGDLPDILRGFRVLMPVSTRTSTSSMAGNKIALTLIELPVHLPDPLERYEETMRSSAAGKSDSHQVEGTVLLEEISDVTSSTLIREGVKVAGALRSFNTIITNVPGPPFQLYLLGAPLESMYPLVPLFHHQGLGIAIFSYKGVISIGLGADWQAIPNLHELVEDLQSSFQELQEVAHLKGEKPMASAVP